MRECQIETTYGRPEHTLCSTVAMVHPNPKANFRTPSPLTGVAETTQTTPNPDKPAIGFVAVVTHDSFEEYELLRFSFELFHGAEHHWFLYCDPECVASLASLPNTECRVFEQPANQTDGNPLGNSKSVCLRKLQAIHDAWETGRFSSVLYLDTDLVFTASTLDPISGIEGDVLLTPHYFESPREEKDLGLWGKFNSGFALMRNRDFHPWWKAAMLSQPEKFGDQQCLDDASSHFRVGHLPKTANVGPWRSPTGTQTIPQARIPQGCLFVKAHMFQPGEPPLDLVQKAFVAELTRLSNAVDGSTRPITSPFREEHLVQRIYAIQCLQYLQESPVDKHKTLFLEIINRDRLAIYKSLLTSPAGQAASKRGGDYISPGLSEIRLDQHFPNITFATRSMCQRKYFRLDSPHFYYNDRRYPEVPLVNRDAAHILYNAAQNFVGKRALEIGSMLGWSTAHLAAGGVIVDAIDPQFADPVIQESIVKSLKSAGVLNRVFLWPGSSPGLAYELSIQQNRRWSLIFIDGNSDHPGPLRDAAIAHEVAETDAIILLHNAVSPDVARALAYLKAIGWNVTICYTAQIMGVAWRGNVIPIPHIPDPKLEIAIPEYLKEFAVAGRKKDLAAELQRDSEPAAVEI